MKVITTSITNNIYEFQSEVHVASFPGSPLLARNYCVTFKLALARNPYEIPCECEFKGHAIITRKGGEPGNEAKVHGHIELL